MDALLGVDLGTTNIKAVIYDLRGQPLAMASRPTPTIVQGTRRACHDPEALWREATETIRQALGGLTAEVRVGAMASASVGEAGVPLGERGEVLYPIIAWYDERTAPQARWWARVMGEQQIYRRTGLPLGHTFTLNKLLWLSEHEPAIFRRTRRWLCVSDYLAYRLTGAQCMGYSLASRTMALDLRARRWSQEMLDCAALPGDLFPPLVAEGTMVGRVSERAAEETGLKPGTPVYVGGHDHVCAALAMGVSMPGLVLDSTGTTEAELTTLEEVDEHLARADLSFCLGCHVARDRYYSIGSILGAGSMVSWLADLLWGAEAASDREGALEELTRAAGTSAVGARGLYILPHLAGAGSPQRDSTARGVLVGLSLAHSRADIARAAIEGLGYELRLLWEAMERFSGRPLQRAMVVGGGARNAFWNQTKADITGRTLSVSEHGEAAALGAALLAGLGAGVYRDEADAASQVIMPMREFRPEQARRAQYDELFGLLADRIRPLAAELGRRGRLLVLEDKSN